MAEYRTESISSLSHLDRTLQAIRGPLYTSIRDAHILCGESYAANDRACMIRGWTIAGIRGVIVPGGLVDSLEEGPRKPIHTTWSRLPSALGDEAVMVSCVKSLGGNRYKLTHGEPNAMPSYDVQKALFEGSSGIEDLLLGIHWKRKRRKRGEPLLIAVQVYMLGGSLDRKRRIFHATDSKLVLDDVFGTGPGSNDGGPRIEPKGPTPTITRRAN